jgi:osmotically-inducible protein OsmY
MNMQSLRAFGAALAGAALFTAGAACERPSDRREIPSTTAPTTTTTPKTTPNVGEGEREAWRGEAATQDPRAIIERFQAEIAKDPSIAAVSNASLILTQGGELVLQGTAESDDVKDELEDYAEELAGVEVRNDIEVADK